MDKTNLNDSLSTKILSNNKDEIKKVIAAMEKDKSLFKEQYLAMIKGQLGFQDEDGSATASSSDDSTSEEEERHSKKRKQKKATSSPEASKSTSDSGKKRKQSPAKEPTPKKKKKRVDCIPTLVCE